jgi:hypothetical protein
MPLVLRVSPDDTVAAVKARALEAQGIAATRHARYEVKLGGALLRDESRTLAACGARAGAPLVVLSRRRRPVR